MDIDVLSVFNNYPVYNETKQNIITVLIAVLTIILIVVILSLLINVASKNYYTALNSLLEKQVAAQINHYEKLEKLNRDIRTFRHDYINHLSSINTLIEEGCYPDAQRYIERLTEATHRHEAVFITGNRLADAILTDKSDSCKDFADIDFEGCVTDKIENSDICIILANALDNAVEACRKCSGRSKISIAAQVRQGYWTMTMRNPTIGEDSEGPMKTSKEDEQNHGFGLLSIEQAVKRYDGTMRVGIKDGMFEMSVVMKISVDE
ncbi:MAG: sensor histidine kinase [Eubacterium sp.]